MNNYNSLPLISVIVPVYNNSQYLCHCLDSIKDQTYKNVEIILIDDGSTDNSGMLCDKYSEIDQRFVVVHQENKGVAAARNRALDLANGDYIIQVDSDDYISDDAIESLYKNMEKSGADLCVCNFRLGIDTNFNFAHLCNTNVNVYSGNTRFKKLFDDKKFHTIGPCGKLYKKELFNDLRYPDGKIHEDEYLAHYIVGRCKKIAYMDDVLYYYVVNNHSITHSNFSMKRLDAIDALEDRIKYINAIGDTLLTKLCYIDFLKRFQYYYYGVKYNFPEKKDEINKLYAEYRKYYFDSLKYLNLYYRFRFGIFIVMPTLNYIIKKLAHGKSIDT